MLTQPFDLHETQITIHLHNPVQEMMLNMIKTELTNYLREKLKNTLIQVLGELKQPEEKKIIYTNREKFEYLLKKNPALKDLRDRLGLDTDF